MSRSVIFLTQYSYFGGSNLDENLERTRNQRRHSWKDKGTILLKVLLHVEDATLSCLCEVTFCFIIRLLDKGVPIDVLGQHLGLRHSKYIAHLRTFQETETVGLPTLHKFL